MHACLRFLFVCGLKELAALRKLSWQGEDVVLKRYSYAPLLLLLLLKIFNVL